MKLRDLMYEPFLNDSWIREISVSDLLDTDILIQSCVNNKIVYKQIVGTSNYLPEFKSLIIII